MKKYVYENATVYITIPTEKQIDNIRKSTEQFVKRLAAKGELDNGVKRRNNRRIGITNSDAGRRDKKVKENNSKNKAIHSSL